MKKEILLTYLTTIIAYQRYVICLLNTVLYNQDDKNKSFIIMGGLRAGDIVKSNKQTLKLLEQSHKKLIGVLRKDLGKSKKKTRKTKQN